MLWSTRPEGNTLVNAIPYQERQPYRWARHPSNPEHLIFVTHKEAHIYNWQSLERLTGSAGILLEGSVLPELSIRSVMPCFNGKVLATTFRESLRPNYKSKLVLWDTSAVIPDSTTATPVPDYHYLTSEVETIIGTTSMKSEQMERLIFLHASNWVCSAD